MIAKKEKAHLKGVKDYVVSGEKFELLYDATLDLLATHPKPKNISSYYESADYISHTDSKVGLVDYLFQKVKGYMLKRKLNLVSSYFKKGNILDIGAGTGDFLNCFKHAGWDVSGVEPNNKARNLATKKDILLAENIDAITNSFDVITMWHVLEHVSDLDKQLHWLQDHIKPNGHLFIAVPNYRSYDARKYKEFWAAYDVPRHLYHFSQTSIEKIFAKKGFKLIATKPLIFDAYYVSLLSEGYKKSKFKFIKAFYTGLLSNLKALKTSEYSSIIYVLKKA